jgi:hypothetical protein
MRLDMRPHQQKRIGNFSVLVVLLSWVDFAGDVSWTCLRFYEHGRGKAHRIEPT